MHNARKVVSDIREQLAEVEAKLMRHPYIQAVEDGRVSRARLGLFAAQQRYIIPSDLRSLGLLVNRYGAESSGAFFLGSIEAERAALDALDTFERALGRGGESPDPDELLPGAVAYPHFLAWLAMYGSDAEFAAAFLLNLQAWGKNCGRLAQALRDVHGFEGEEVKFFDLFAAESPEFEAAALAVVQGGLERGVRKESLALAARLLQAYELMYWDLLYDASTLDS